MGLYARYVLPKLIDMACAQEPMAKVRATYVSRARGRVLEIGFGTGHNLAHYSTGESSGESTGEDAPVSLFALEPATDIVERARERLASATFPVEVSNASAEDIPVEDSTFDTVVSTWTLCSVPNVYRCLAELRRVLKPRGRLIFAEHGASPEPAIQRWQRRIEPAWKIIGGGCHLSRSADVLIASAGFRIDELETGYLPGPKLATFTYRGVAAPR